MGITFVLSAYIILTLKVLIGADLRFMNHQGPHFHLNAFFNALLKNKFVYILVDLKVSKPTTSFHYWVNYP